MGRGGILTIAHKAGNLFVVFDIFENLGVIRRSTGITPNDAVVNIAVCPFQSVQIHSPMHYFPDQHLSGHVKGNVVVVLGPVLHDMAQHIFLVSGQTGVCRTAAHIDTAVRVKVGHVHTVGQFASNGGGSPGRFLLLEGVVVGIVPMSRDLLNVSCAGSHHHGGYLLIGIKFRFRFLRGRIGNLRLAGSFTYFRQIFFTGWKKLDIFIR